ncbi:MAG: hypothetical protein ACNA8K_15290 [Cyclonatronaceae bacterium]
MKIGKPELTEIEHSVKWQVTVEKLNDYRVLWFTVPLEYRDMVTPLSDSALTALIIPAMAAGDAIDICGKISERLYRAVAGPAQHVLSLILPALRPVKVTAGTLVDKPQTGSGVATGFSGGVDSYAVLADYHYDKTRSDLRLTHLLFHNVGSHRNGSKGRQLFRSRFDHLKPFADRTGLPFIPVDSNLDEFYSDFRFLQTHTLRNMAAALLLQQGIGHYIYASSYPYSQIVNNRKNRLCLNDSMLLPILSGSGFEAIHSGAEYSRLQKIIKISDIEDSYDALNVCTDSVTNCSKCMKCLRTLFALELTGNLERYSASFDLNTYRAFKYRYIPELLSGNQHTDADLREIMRQKGIKIPLWAYPKALVRIIRSYMQ